MRTVTALAPKSIVMSVVSVAISIALGGCKLEQDQTELHGTAAMRSGETIRNASIEGAIVAQHTLYPYHFVQGSSELNELGWRDLEVLVRHFKTSGGEVNLAPGGADEALYKSRSQTLLGALRTAGIAKDRVSVVEGRPGGDGIAGARLVKILDAPTGPLGATPTAGSTQSSSSAAMTGTTTGVKQ